MSFNSFMLWLLHSPFHALISKRTLGITFRGSKSGNTYTLPVDYVSDGEELLITSLRERTWWRNLRGGADVNLLLRGKEVPARAEVFEDITSVGQGLAQIVRIKPQWARFLKVKLYEKGDPSMIELDMAARKRVVVRVKVQ